MSSQKCSRCGSEWPDSEIYCPECMNCGICYCCPCNRKDCWTCMTESIETPVTKPLRVKGLSEEDWESLY